jgi:TIR domain
MPDSEELKPIPSPKVFVSYAQSDERTPWISDISKRLIHDGVDVVVDLYDLAHSADMHVFMERCVNDASITRVLMMCDLLYCQKANDREGGVGKETQIISEEVYNDVGANKFLPIFCGLYDDGKPSLPTYLKSRYAINFSTPEKVEENWEILLRDLFEQPLHQKPPLGKPPAYITTPQLSARAAASKFASWRQAIHRGATIAPSIFQQYLETLTEEMRRLYLTQTTQEEWENELAERLDQFTPIRDELLEAFSYFAGEQPEKGAESIGATLERLLPLKFAPDPLPTEGWPTRQTESTAIFLYETYLRTVAQLSSAGAFATLSQLLKRYYTVPVSERHNWGNNARFAIFGADSPTLNWKKQRLQLNRYDLLADLIGACGGAAESVFQSVREADLLLALRSIIHKPSSIWWYPRTLIYSPLQVLPLFIRFEQRKQFKTLCDLLDIPDKAALVTALDADERGRGSLFRDSFNPTSIRALINLQNLDTLD